MHILHQYFIIDNFNIYHRGRIFDFCYIKKIFNRSFADILYIRDPLLARLQNDPGRSCT